MEPQFGETGGFWGLPTAGDKLPSSVEIDLGSFVVDRPDGHGGKIGEADRYR
ncbi:hypothetical protein [Microcoleus vaginatus]|uniref:hypothetical protein n=1 Tax=Microcoleus vaginatus TaxID=119532 RepID=UPI00403FC071